MDNFKETPQPYDIWFHNIVFFMMTSVSVIGYGSNYSTIYTRVLLIFLLGMIAVAL